jgi:hypothetical protein
MSEPVGDRFRSTEDLRAAARMRGRDLRRRRRFSRSGTVVVLAAAVITLGIIAINPAARVSKVTTSSPSSTGPAPTAAPPAHPGPPVPGDVSGGRFTHPAALDDGGLVVTPLPATEQPPLGESTAQVLFGSDTLIRGTPHRGQIFGFGLVTVRSTLTPGLSATPAWVGAAWGGGVSCLNSTPSTTAPSSSGGVMPTPGYTAVIILGTGTKVLNYTSRTSVCGYPPTGPSVTAASQIVSIPWQLVSFTSSTVSYRYQLPACLPVSALPDVSIDGTLGGAATLMLEVAVPYDLGACPQLWRTGSAALGPPPGPGAPQPHYTQIDHGPIGPVVH